MQLEKFWKNGFKKEFSYRELFVKFRKEVNSSLVYVTCDGWGKGSFISYANNENDFIKDCKEWAKENKNKL